jgi:hypothetical protein
VKTGNPSACVTVKCKLWKSTIAPYLNVIKRTCNRGANKSEPEPVIFVARTTLHVTILILRLVHDTVSTT